MKNSILVFVAVIAAYTAGCQNLSVSGFNALETDMTARTIAPERDVNGDLAALIRVVSTASGFVFEGGSLGIVKAEQKVGEWWVYVPDGARTLTIRHPQLGVLRNYAYPVSINGGSVYELVLVHGDVEVIVKERDILTEFVIIDSDPQGADIYLNNVAVGKTPFSSDKPEGRYEWRIEKSLYLPEAGVFNLKAGERVELDFELTPNFGQVLINSYPESGAEIIFNGLKMGKTTPATLNELPTGEHTVTLSHPWYETITQKVIIRAGETDSLSLDMTPTFAELTIDAEADEEVYLNGSKKGSGSYSTRLAPGVYQVEVRKPSHAAAKKQVSLKSGDEEVIVLEPTPLLGNLKVQSTPINAEIFLDGLPYGTAPQILRDLLVGAHTLELRLSGYGALTTEVTVKEGETVDVNEVLSSMGRLSVNANVDDVEVYLNGSLKGLAPLELNDLEPGAYKVELKKNGYDTVTRNIDLVAGNIEKVDATLTEAAGSLTLYSEPSGASVFIEGSLKGTTPGVLRGLPAGTYNIEFRKDGYRTQIKRVYIKSAMNDTKTIELKPNKATRLASHSNVGYYMYPFEESRYLGIGFGSLNMKSMGIYMNVTLNAPVFTYSLYELDDMGNTDSPWDLVPTGEVREGSVRFSSGITFRLAYPFWGYVGGGYFQSRYLVEVEEYGSSTGTYYGTEWYENPSRKETAFFPEFGVLLRPGNTFVLKYGVAISDGVVHQFGIGLQI